MTHQDNSQLHPSIASQDADEATGSPPPHKPPKHRPRWVIYLIRLLVTAIVAILLLLVALLAATSSETGSRFLIEKIALETGTQLKYSEGSIRNGVWVSDVKIAQGEDITITVNRAYVQLGWRALFARQVHLVNPDIDKVKITNKKPSTGEPFDYAKIELPVTLQLENARANEIIYEQAGSEPVVLHSINIPYAKWSGSQVELTDSALSYGDSVDVSRATGNITLEGHYPLNISADVHVSALDGVYFDTLAVKAGGSLKRTVGTLSGKYNQHDISGSFIAQGLDKNAPFSARLDFDEILLPYAEEQHIVLTNGSITADGVVSNIELRINTDLSAKDIPSGHYHGRGIIVDGGMQIPYLRANTPSGALTLTGDMRWADEFELDATILGDGFKIREAMPVEYRDYQAYLPQTLTGALGVRYYAHDRSNGDTRFEFDLNQKDGERIQAVLTQNQNISDAPWRIRADWANLIRQGVPQIGEINSRQGSANIRLEEGRTFITAEADITRLNAAPRGRYAIEANIEKGERLHLTDFYYQGVVGQLRGTGRLDFATLTQPLRWQLDIHADPLRANAYFDTPNKTPFDTIKGHIIATGRMRDEQGVMIHEVEIKDSDLDARLVDGAQIHLIGQGSGVVRLRNSEIEHLTAKFDGSVNQSLLPQLPQSAISIDVSGDMNALNIRHATLEGESGKVSLTGGLTLDDGIGWDIAGRFDGFDTAKFVNNDNLIAVITGDVVSQGKYRDGKLDQLALKFNGGISNKRLPNGNLMIDLSGSDSRFVIHRLKHQGDAGSLDATGWLDISRGVAWQLDAQMDELNIGAFVKQLNTRLNGHIGITGNWQDERQELHIRDLNLTGMYNNQPLKASGSLYAKLSLPKDLSGYINHIKQTSRRPTTSDELLDLRRRIDANARQAQNIIHALKADDLTIQIGDNLLAMNGDESQLTTSLNVVDLGQILPKASGTLKGGVILINDGNALPSLYVDASVTALRMPNLVIQNAQVLGKIVNLGNSDSQLLIHGNEIIAMGKVIKSARLDFSGTESAHTLTVATKSGDIQAAAHVAGSLDRDTMRYTGVLSDGFVQSRYGEMAQRQPTEFSYGIKDNSVQVAAHCWQMAHIQNDGVGVLCLKDSLSYTPTSGHINLVIQNLDTQVLSAALPSDIQWQSMLNGRVLASWRQGSKPIVDAVLYSDNGSIGLTQDDTGYVEMPYQRASVIAKNVDNGLKIRTDILGSAGRGYADVIVDPYGKNKPISGDLVMNDLNLAVLRPFFPKIQTLTGRVNLAGSLGGTLSKPLFNGDADLKEGALAVVGVPLPLSDINAHMTVRGTNAALKGSFTGGSGQGLLQGELDWANEVQANLTVSGENLSINRPPLVTAEISPDLQITVKPTKKYVNIQGVISVPKATIRPPEAAANIVSESPDVTVLDRRSTGDINQILARVEPWSINADLGVDLGSRVEFRGFGAKVPLAGALHLTQSGQGSMQALGVVQVSERTKIDVIGQNLNLNYAQLRFNGAVTNPYLSIEGEKQIEGQTVGVRIRGTATDPDITVFNDAGLSEQQAMNALVTGRISEASDAGISEQGFRSRVTNHLAAAGLSLGLSGTRNVTNQIGQALGLQSLTIDASGNADDTNVNVTGYINPDLYIRYGVGVFNAESSLSMRYQLTRRVYVEATSAAENMVDVIYRWKF